MSLDKMELVVLGSAGGAATPQRSHPSYLLDLGGEYIMFDCGDGTLMRYQEAQLNINKPLTIFISHWHLDHYGGLPSLLRGLSIMGRTNPIALWTDNAFILEYLDHVVRPNINTEGLRFEVKMELLKFGSNFNELPSNNGRYIIKYTNAKHRSAGSYAFRVEEIINQYTFDWKKAEQNKIPKEYWSRIKKLGYHDGFSIPELKLMLYGSDYQIKNEYKQPRVFCYSGDTEPFAADKELFKNATLLLHDATYVNENLLDAVQHKHSTALSATRCAIRCKAQFLLLIHRSRRYFPGKEDVHIKETAMELGLKRIDMRYEVAQDLMRIDIKLDTKHEGRFFYTTRYPDGNILSDHGDPIREGGQNEKNI